jgi:hypothetical protein
VAFVGAAVSAAAAVAMVILAERGRFVDAGWPVYALAAILAGAAVAAIVAVTVGRLAAFAAVQAASTMAVVLVFVTFAWPGLEASESTKPLVARLKAGGLTDQLAGAYRVPDVSLDFYLGRTLLRETDARELERRVAADPDRLWVVRANEVGGIAAHLPLRVEPVMTVSRRSVVRLSSGSPGGGRKDAP